MRLITVIMITVLFAPVAMAQTAAADSAAASRSIPEQHSGEADFVAFLDQLDVALQRFVNGDADGFKAAWAHADDVTVAGGFGGEIVQGWNVLSPRLSGVANAYSDTVFSTSRIGTRATGDFGYVIQHEYFHREGAEEPYRQYRVTMLFRREAGEWKLFHRHADSQMDFRIPQ
jgi:ketosteroid isomerase-like protein